MAQINLCLNSQYFKLVCQHKTMVKEITCNKLQILCHLLLSNNSKECSQFQWLLHPTRVWTNKTCKIICMETKLSLTTSSNNKLQLIRIQHHQFTCLSHSMLIKVFKTNNLSSSILHHLINKTLWCSHSSSSNMRLCNTNNNSCSNNSSSNSKIRHLLALVSNSKVNNSSIWIRCESIST